MTKKFLDLMKSINPTDPRSSTDPKKNKHTHISRHHLMKLLKTIDKIKSEMQTVCRRTTVRLKTDFSFEIMQARIQYPVKMSFRNEGRIKICSDEENLRDMQRLEEVLQAEGK